MPGEEAFTVEGIVSEVLSERTCRVDLENGHRLFGFVLRREAGKTGLKAGEKVTVKLSPFDLSEGRILKTTKTI
jgi:translation initiation factor IF-1